jgi:hypothetical protein
VCAAVAAVLALALLPMHREHLSEVPGHA